MADFLHTTPPATTIKTRIEDIKEDIIDKQKEKSNVARNISQLLQSQKYLDDDYLDYLVKKEKTLEKELTVLKKRKQDIQDPKTHTKKRRPKYSRAKSLSLGRSNPNKKKLPGSNSLGGTRKRKPRK